MGVLQGKVAVVTGGGRGVGRAVALAFAAEGAAVAVAARTSGEVERVAEEVLALGGKAVAVRADVTRQEEVDALFARVNEEISPVDILVNNAAVIDPLGMVWETEPSAWQEAFDVNVIGMVRCVRAVLPTMKDRRSGKIIIVGSRAGWSDGWAARNTEQMAYGVTKAAVNRFSTCLAEQVKPYGINVNCVGVSAQTRLDQQTRQALARLRGAPPPPALNEIPVEKRTLPEENVAPFVFLASSASDHITGTYLEANNLPDRLRRNQ